jgi:hypothetical protein
MRTLAIVAAVIFGAAIGWLAGLVVGVAVPDHLLAPGWATVAGTLAGGVGLGWLVARRLPRQPPSPSNRSRS